MKRLGFILLMSCITIHYTFAQADAKNKLSLSFNQFSLDKGKAKTIAPILQFERKLASKYALVAAASAINDKNKIEGLTAVTETRKRIEAGLGVTYQVFNTSKWYFNVKPGLSILHRNDTIGDLKNFLALSLSSTYKVTNYELINEKGFLFIPSGEVQLGFKLSQKLSLQSNFGIRSYKTIGTTQSTGLGIGALF